MKLIFQGDKLLRETDSLFEIGGGGEGIVYRIDEESLAKVYHEIIEGESLTDEQKNKLLKLIDLYREKIDILNIKNCAFPTKLAFKEFEEYKNIGGFLMPHFKGMPKITDVSYSNPKQKFQSRTGFQFSDSSAIRFVFELFSSLYKLHHEAGIILGDINDENFLVDTVTGKPYFIDIDSAVFETYECTVFSKDYIDPDVEERGKSPNDGFYYTMESDNFSAAVLCFEFLFGVNPYSFRNQNLLGLIEAKRRKISILHFVHNNIDEREGIKIVKDKTFSQLSKRVEWLKNENASLYQFFVSIFIEDERMNLVSTLPEDHDWHPTKGFFYNSGVFEAYMKILRRRELQYEKLISSSSYQSLTASPLKARSKKKSKKDPVHLSTFLLNFGVDVRDFIQTI